MFFKIKQDLKFIRHLVFEATLLLYKLFPRQSNSDYVIVFETRFLNMHVNSKITELKRVRKGT